MADHVLVIQDSAHAHQAENVDLAVTHILAINNSAHAHAATEIDLSTPGVLRNLVWTPANGAINIDQGSTVRVEFAADDSNELESLFDEGHEFIDGGTLTDVAVVGDELQLATVVTGEDFEVPRHSDGADITASNHWTKRSDNGICWIDDDIAGETNQFAKYQQYNQGGLWSFDDFGSSDSDVDLRARIRFEDDNGDIFLVGRVTGSSGSTRGYVFRVRAHDNQLAIARLTGGGGGVGVFGLTSVAYTVNADTWYRVRFRISGTSLLGKIWPDGSPEPGSWNTSTSDGTHAGPGDVGIMFVNGTANAVKQLDDFEATPIPNVYEAAGNWISDILAVTPVDRYSASRISWDETVPANTTVTVETRRDGGSWQSCTNGGEIPGFTYDEFLDGVELETRISLATTDDSATPAVSNLRLFFDPCDFGEIEILVDSLSATEANGKLYAYGKQTPAGNDYADLIAEAALVGWYGTPAAGTITAELKYQGVSIGSIAFAGSSIPIRENVNAQLYYSFPALPLESSPFAGILQWTAGDHDIKTDRILEWTVIDKGINLRGDLWYYVAHPTRHDQPASLLTGILALDDFLASILPEGYTRDDFPASMLAQAHRRDDFPTSILPAILALDDFLGSTVIAIQEIHDEPASLVIFAVNRENVIEIHVIAESTFAALGGEGISWN